MGFTPHFDLTELAENQSNRYLTINAALAGIEGGTQGLHADAAVGTGLALTDAQFTGNFMFRLSGASSAFTLTTKGQTASGVVATERFFAVHNADGTYACTVQSDDTGTTVAIAAGATALLYQTGDNIITVATVASSVVIPYDIAFYHPGTVDASSQIIAQIEVARSITIPDDFSGSQAYIGTNPAASFAFDIQKNGVSVGSLTFTTGGVPTFVTTGAEVTMVAGDRLSVLGPATVEATGADIGITFAATVD